MKEDSITIVLEAAEAAGVGLDGLDLGVEAFGDGVGDRMQEVVQQADQMPFEGEGSFLDRLQFRAAGGAEPLVEELQAAGRSGCAQNSTKFFL